MSAAARSLQEGKNVQGQAAAGATKRNDKSDQLLEQYNNLGWAATGQDRENCNALQLNEKRGEGRQTILVAARETAIRGKAEAAVQQ